MIEPDEYSKIYSRVGPIVYVEDEGDYVRIKRLVDGRQERMMLRNIEEHKKIYDILSLVLGILQLIVLC